MLDDVGTKVKALTVLSELGSPTAIVETSSGNFQFVYRLSSEIPVADWGSFFAAIERLVGTPLEGKDAVHLFRLPMGVNTKPGRGGFRPVLTKLEPHLELDTSSVVINPGIKTTGASSGAEDKLGVKALRALMALIPNTLDARDDWIEVGHGLKALCENDADGFEVFDWWSEQHLSYDAANTRAAWDSFGAGGLKSKGVGLRARAEAASPAGYAKAMNTQARETFEDNPPPPPPNPFGGGGGGVGGPSHMGMADDVAAVERGRLGWINGRSGSWAMFDDVMLRWVISTNETAMHQAVRESIDRHLGGGGVSAKTAAMLRKAGWHHSVAGLVRVKPELMLEADRFDANNDLLGLPGGVLEAGALSLTARPGAPADLVTRSTSTIAAPAGARGKYWEKFLDDFTMKDAGLRKWWQAFCGYCLTGHTSEHVVVFVYGPGGNGKSVFLDMVGEVLGDYHERADHRVFMETKGGKHLAPLAVLEGARLVTVPDVAVGATWDMGLVKQASGGGSITANRMRQDPTTFIPRFKIVMAGNEKPRLDTVDDGVRRRMRLVPALFRPKSIDTGLVDKLRGEKAEILRWMVDGWAAWTIGGLPACKTIDDATSDYLDAADVFGRWMGEALSAASKGKVRVADAFRSWEAFKSAEGS